MADTFQGIQVLVVDDQENFLDAVAFEFEILGCQALKAKNGFEGLEAFKSHKIDLVISDIRMPVFDGGQFLDEVRKIAKRTPFIFMTGFSDLKPSEAFDRGADGFLGKPLKRSDIQEALSTLLASDEKKWSTHPHEKSLSKVVVNIPQLTSQSEFQMGKSGFFIPFVMAPQFQNLPKNALIDFDLTFGVDTTIGMKGVGRILWSRETADETYQAGCGIGIVSLEESCRMPVIQFLLKYNGIQTIPRGAIKKGESQNG